jgi:hypothetical protein
MNSKKWLKISLLLVITLSSIVYACKEKKEEPKSASNNEVIMKFNGVEWNTLITTGFQNANTIDVGSFNDASTSAESFYLSFKKADVVKGATFGVSSLVSYQLQHLGSNYTVTDANFEIDSISNTRLELTFNMNLNGGAKISEGSIKVNF